MKQYKLIVFDLDGTLTYPYTTDILPGVRLGLRRLRKRYPRTQFAIATNKGNIGLKYWRQVVREQGEDIGDPNSNGWTVESTMKQIDTVASEIGAKSYKCFRYQSKKGNWSPVPPDEEESPIWSMEWRKPNPGMLLQAMADHDATPVDTLYVGNEESDKLAAENAGVDFSLADDFFKDSKPRIVISYCPRHAWSWLTMRDAVDQEATTANYEAMLRSASEIAGHDIELRQRKTDGAETVTLINSEGKDHLSRIFESVQYRVQNEWINCKWLKFTSVSAHIDALIDAGRADLLIVAPSYIKDAYPAEEVAEAADKFAEAEAFKRKFRFYLG